MFCDGEDLRGLTLLELKKPELIKLKAAKSPFPSKVKDEAAERKPRLKRFAKIVVSCLLPDGRGRTSMELWLRRRRQCPNLIAKLFQRCEQSLMTFAATFLSARPAFEPLLPAVFSNARTAAVRPTTI
jgi:hypothetical protein